jgi:large subunit ribosomal protein L6
MSRVGKNPVILPSGVTARKELDVLTVKGVKGDLSISCPKDVVIDLTDTEVCVSPANESKLSRALWGTFRSRINNMVIGVSQGFVKSLEIKGVGYRASIQGNLLTLALGYSHEIKFVVPDDITITVDKQTSLKVEGIDSQKVGQIASQLRALRKPEPYKGKGVRYTDEYVRIKEGKKK